MRIEAPTLEGRYVRLEPLTHAHADGLRDAIECGQLWTLHFTLVPQPSDVAQFIADARASHERGEALAFATVERATGRIAGSTRYMKVDLANKRLEIGFTFLGEPWQRSAINTEAKLLMLTHAFEVLEVNRVELLTDVLNTKSRAAIARLGATQEGILRRHMVMRDGRIRDSVIFSIIASEWPETKHALHGKLR